MIKDGNLKYIFFDFDIAIALTLKFTLNNTWYRNNFYYFSVSNLLKTALALPKKFQVFLKWF
jgi:hypothetical protein